MKYSGFAVFALIVVIVTVGYARFGALKNLHPPKLNKPEPVIARVREVPVPPVFPVEVADATGQTMLFQVAPKKIVSVAPSVTEVLFDLGLGDHVVADTNACDFPQKATQLPHIGGAFDMDLEKIVSLQPDLVVADGTVNKQIILRMQAAGLKVFVMMPDTLEHCWESVRRLGRATGCTVEAAGLINDIRDHLENISRVVRQSPSTVKVMVLYDTATLYTSGPNTLIGELIKVCGGKNIAPSNDPLNSENVVEQAPEVIICSSNLEANVAKMPGWKGTVPAVTNTAYFHTSANATLIRPCRRMITGANELAKYLHPDVYTSDGRPAPFVKTGSTEGKPGK